MFTVRERFHGVDAVVIGAVFVTVVDASGHVRSGAGRLQCPPLGAAPLKRCAAIEMCSGQNRAKSAPPQDPDAEPTTAGLYSR